MSTAKVAVSIPRETLAALERARRQLGRSRSALVTAAVEAWLRSREVDERDQRYAQGYLRQPERGDEAAAIATAVVAAWEPWK